MLTAAEANKRTIDAQVNIAQERRREEFKKIDQLIKEHIDLGHYRTTVVYPLDSVIMKHLRSLGYAIEILSTNSAPIISISWKTKEK